MRNRSLFKSKVAGIIQHQRSISRPLFLQPSLHSRRPEKRLLGVGLGCCARALPTAAVVSGLLLWGPPAPAWRCLSSRGVPGPVCAPWPRVHARGAGERLWSSWGQNNCKLLVEPWAAAGRSSRSRSQLSRNIGLHLFLRLVEGMRVSMATCVFCSSGLLTHFWGSREEKRLFSFCAKSSGSFPAAQSSRLRASSQGL